MYSQFPSCGNESLGQNRGDTELEPPVVGGASLKHSKGNHLTGSQGISSSPEAAAKETCRVLKNDHTSPQKIESLTASNPQCLTLTESEFHDYVKNNSVIGSYMSEWGATPSYMPKICGVGSEGGPCACGGRETNNPSHKFWLSSYLITPGMPFSVEYSEIFGEVYTTPFFSVIPKNVSAVPQPIFSLSRLNISRIVNCHVFRHELAFNPHLLIDPPQNMLECIDSNKIWYVLKNEICDYLKTPETPSSFPVLAEMFLGIKALMLNTLPVDFAPYVVEFYEPLNLVAKRTTESSYSVKEIIKFTERVIETVVLPGRKSWVTCMKESFSKGFDSLTQLVRGFKIAISLLNLTKIDHINNKIKERCDLLRQNTGKLEKEYFRNKIRAGSLNETDFGDWLKGQPPTEIFRNSRDPFAPRIYVDTSTMLKSKSDILNHLVGGFISTFFYHNRDHKSLRIFSQDASRIRSLKERVEALICVQVEEYVINSAKEGLCSFGESNTLLNSSNLRESKMFQQIKMRSLRYIAERVLEVISNATLQSSSSGAFRTHTRPDPLASRFSAVIYEVSMILLLHWIGTGDYYYYYFLS